MKNTPVAEALKSVLADTYALYLKTQNYHWNVEGPHFKIFHEMFEEQYQDLAAAIDTIAELIRGLGEKAPGTFAAMTSRGRINPGDENATAMQMIKDLAEDQATIQATLQTALDISQNNNDEVVSNFLTERLTVHRKAGWMLKSSLVEE